MAIIHHPDVRSMLMSMRVQTEAAPGLTYVAGAAADSPQCHRDVKKRAYYQALYELLAP